LTAVFSGKRTGENMTDRCNHCGALFSAQAQADAWRALLRWVCEAPSTVDAKSRTLYAQAMLDGADFEWWFDDVAGREAGHNAPPPAVLMVLRPYLLGKVAA